MADKNKQKIGKGDTAEDVSAESKVKVEPTTSLHQIKDLSIEQFTKVSNFFLNHFEYFIDFSIVLQRMEWHLSSMQQNPQMHSHRMHPEICTQLILHSTEPFNDIRII